MTLEMAPDEYGSAPYVHWKHGDPKITLDGDFTIAELQQFIEHMTSNTDQADETEVQ